MDEANATGQAVTRVAVIGVGKIAIDHHIPVIRAHPRFDLVGTVDPARSNQGVAHFADLGALLSSGLRCDAAVVCTPPAPRAAIAHALIAAGIHVMLEKPPASTVEEADALACAAEQANVALFAAWHARFAAAVAPASVWLARRTLASARITWRESAEKWHPGQNWLWRLDGFGVFDPGINALSLLTRLVSDQISVAHARLEPRAPGEAPVAADVMLYAGHAPIAVDLDFREAGRERWEIEFRTADGATLTLIEGGAAMAIDDIAQPITPASEYRAVYDRFAEMVATRGVDCDVRPLQIVEQILAWRAGAE